MTKLVTYWDYIRGFIGSAMAVTLPFIKALTPFVQFAGACLGIYLVVISIRHKRLEYKKLKNDK